MSADAVRKANLTAMELIDNNTGLGTHTNYGLAEYPKRQELLTNLHNEDELARRVHFSTGK